MCRWVVCGLFLLLVVLVLFVVQVQLVFGLLLFSLLQCEYLVVYLIIVVGQYDSGWLFFEFFCDGEQVGLGLDYLLYFVCQFDVKVEVCCYLDWIFVLDVVCCGEIDVVMNVGFSVDCICCMVYIVVYSEVFFVLVGWFDDLCVFDMLDLDGLRVVIEQDFLIGLQVCV